MNRVSAKMARMERASLDESEALKAPFVWFGGKRRVAPQVWDALGDVDQYVEPFAGSLAVPLGRPRWHVGTCETVNDCDSFLINVWRALRDTPDEVARWCDAPVDETELLSRHLWLVNTGRERIAKLETDPLFSDARTAGYWLYGINAWIGSGWCSGNGPWHIVDGEVRQLPHLGNAGQGVNRKLPHLGNAGQGVNRQLPHLGDAGQGVNRQRPHLGNAGQDSEPQTSGLIGYFNELSARIRNMRICCGDWTRVVTDGALSYGETVGIFMDPPYLGEVRTKDLYRVDDHEISHAVREWCLENGDNPRYRIVLCGYRAEHEDKMPPTWRRLFYSASKSYGTSTAVGNGKGNDSNRHNEALWFSPNCIDKNKRTLFE